MTRAWILALMISPAAVAGGLKHRASFDETFVRFPSPYAVVQALRMIVPAPSMDDASCLQVGSDSAPLLGTIDPLRGSSLEKAPGDLFYQYFQNCVHELVDGTFVNDGALLNAPIILGDQTEAISRLMYLECRAGGQSQLSCPILFADKVALDHAVWALTSWASLQPRTKAAFVAAFVDYLVGPGVVLRAQNYIGPQSAFGVSLSSRTDLVKFLVQTLDGLAGDRAFFIKDAYANIAIILRLGPALKA